MPAGPRYGVGPLGNFVLVSTTGREEEMPDFLEFAVGDTKVPFLSQVSKRSRLSMLQPPAYMVFTLACE